MSVDDEAEHLRNISAFAHLDRSRLKLLAFASALSEFQPGDVLFRQGEVGDAVYVIIKGEAQVLVERPDREVVLAEIGPEDVVGEVAALCNVPRTATVRAISSMQTLIIPKDVFFELVVDAPSVGLNFMRLMANRFNRTLDRLLSDD